MALAGELVGVGGHFLFLGLALVSKDWRFLQRMITAPCILFLFYGSVLPFTCHLAIPISASKLALARRPLLFSNHPWSRPTPAPVPQRCTFPTPRSGEGRPHSIPLPPCPQLAWFVPGVRTVADSEAADRGGSICAEDPG